jgi:predicted CoA-binding protein
VPGHPDRVPATIDTILGRPRTWAVVGCSPDPARDSNRIARLLRDRGNRIVPVNPGHGEILGERCYASLADAAADQPIDVVDVFRRSEQAGVHVDEAIEIGAEAVWLQLGVVDEVAAQRARDAGLMVVMDRCPAIEFGRMERAHSL